MRSWIILLIILMVVPMSVQAQATFDKDPGLTPENGILYWVFDRLPEQARLSIPIDLANVKADYMDERIAEYQRTQSNASMNNYNHLANTIHQDLENEDNATRERVMERLQLHVQVLQQVREQVPDEAKQAIDNAIQNSRRAEQQIGQLPPVASRAVNQGQSQSQSPGQEQSNVNMWSQTSSYINVPSTINLDDDVEVSGALYNPSDSPVTSLEVDVTAKKRGLWGLLMREDYTQTYNAYIPPKDSASATYTIPANKGTQYVPENMIKGDWEIHIKITGQPQNTILINTVKNVRIV